MAFQKPWAQLVSLTDLSSDPVQITNNEFSFGRAKNCDMCLSRNKMVSGNHCKIMKERGGVFLQDSSTNGTLINLQDKIHNSRQPLKHGDEIHIVYKKNEPDVNVGFVFQDLAELEKEDSDQTLEYSSSDSNGHDQTQEMEQDDATETPGKSTTIQSDEPPAKIAKVPSLYTAAAREGWGEGAKKAVATTETSDSYEDMLVCSICQDVFHQAVSLQPCMHSFCGGCYSDWMKRSRECPACRKKVSYISKNHLVNKMVEVYLKRNPDKARSEEDLKGLNEKNRIMENMKFPTDQCVISHDDDDYDSDGPFSDSDDDELPVNFGASLINLGSAAQVHVPQTVCRTCPGYAGRIDHPASFVALAGTSSASSSSSSSGPLQTAEDPGEGPSSGVLGQRSSLPDVKTMADPPGYVCVPGQTHVLCQCCLEPMPDLRDQYLGRDVLDGRPEDPDVRPMQCKICDRTYCHAFWGCRRSSCSGCIGKFKDLTFDSSLWRTIVLNNATESAILKQYADSKKMTMRDLLRECCERLDAKTYKFTTSVFNLNKITSRSSLCSRCGQRLFADLAVQYRSDIPAQDLPDGAKNRPDCYWGKNCRTQVKPHHAQRYNHICEQTRFN